MLKQKSGGIIQQNVEQQQVLQQLKNRQQVLENMIRQPFTHQQGVKAVLSARHSLSGILGVVSELLIANIVRVCRVYSISTG